MRKHRFISSANKQPTVNVLEYKIHVAIADYLNMVIKRPSRWHTVEVSNQQAGRAGMFKQIALKRKGVKTGWPDIEIFHNAQDGFYSPIIFLEVKTPEGKLTDKQEALHTELREDGHIVEVIMSRGNEITSQIDKNVGAKMSKQRIAMGLSRKQLARQIDVSHQQLRKYEDGSNRITLGRLYLIARALNKPLSYFFNEIEAEQPINSQHQRMAIEVARNFMNITSTANQSAVNVLVRTLARNI